MKVDHGAVRSYPDTHARACALSRGAGLALALLGLGLLLSGCDVFRFALARQESALLPAAQGDARLLPEAPRYHLQVTLDPQRHAVFGQLQVDFTNAESAPLDRLYFRLFPNAGRIYGDGSLLVTAARVNDEPVTTALSLENTALEVPLPGLLGRGEKAQVSLDFTAVLPVDFGAGQDAYGIFNQSGRQMTLMSWYPILAVYDAAGWNLDPVYSIGDAVYSDVAFYTMDVAAPPELTLAATGVLAGQQSRDGLTLYRYVSGPVRDFSLVASPDFQAQQQYAGETLVTSYAAPGLEAGAQRALQVTVRSVEVYNEKFGLYPYAELDVVAAPMRRALGMEMPGLILVDSGEYPEFDDPAFTDLVAHEAAHQWWYGVVGNDVIDEPWLDEALTTYSAALYAQAAEGQAFYDGMMAFRRGRYDQMVQEGWDGPVAGSLAYFAARPDPGDYSPVVYSKGAVFFEALRQEIGDLAFFSALQAYYTLYRYQTATAADLLGAFETAAGRELDGFYNQWLYLP